MIDVVPALTALMTRTTGVDGAVTNLAQLSGGANMESSAFAFDGKDYVLRRAPSAAFESSSTYGHDVEAMLVRKAYAAGVKAPEVIAELSAADGIGTGYIMRRVMAEVNPAKILGNPPPSLLADCARELARIHAIPCDGLEAIVRTAAADQLAELKTSFCAFGGDRPVFALALRWLEDHLPAPNESVFIHGDFRMGNIMVDADGLAAVLDWELVRVGDRYQDIAYGCINSWRFGQLDKPAFGCGSFDALWAAYEAESGHKVDPARFRWWLVYATLWWGICCLRMAEIWRSGMDATLERAVIGRRASETEVDLLMLLEDDAPEAERARITLEPPAPPRRMGEPSAVEMLEALSGWIERDVKAKAQGRDRFMAAVALNALGMLKREAENATTHHDKALADDLICGRASLATPGLLARLKQAALAKLAADQPKYSALAAATRKWSM